MLSDLFEDLLFFIFVFIVMLGFGALFGYF